MIKELIKDIAFDKIKLSQALTRSKLIAYQIKNDTFKSWLNKELNGYEFNDPLLPAYRKIWSEIFLIAEFPFGQTQTFPVVLPDDRKDIEGLLNFHIVSEPISIVEQDIAQLSDNKGHIYLSGVQVQLVSELYKQQLQRNSGMITRGYRTIGKAQLSKIVELTKQKLLDTLQDLEEQFPEIDNKYIINQENDKKVHNIITNNIYGNNNPLNIAAGTEVKQGNIHLTINEANFKKLKEFGLEEQELEDLIKLDKETPHGNPDRKRKIMSWLGKVTASMTARGIYDKIPELFEYVGDLF